MYVENKLFPSGCHAISSGHRRCFGDAQSVELSREAPDLQFREGRGGRGGSRGGGGEETGNPRYKMSNFTPENWKLKIETAYYRYKRGKRFYVESQLEEKQLRFLSLEYKIAFYIPFF